MKTFCSILTMPALFASFGILAVCMSCNLSAIAQSGVRSEHILPAYSARLGSYASPDKEYIATFALGEAEVGILTVHAVKDNNPKHISHRVLLKSVQDVQGFVWVPGKPHSLIFASSGIYGKASLAIWKGGTEAKMLCQVKHLDSEWFQLDGISADGKVIVYRHARHDAEIEYTRKIRLTLPE